MTQPSRATETFYTLSISVKKELLWKIEQARRKAGKNRSEFVREIIEKELNK